MWAVAAVLLAAWIASRDVVAQDVLDGKVIRAIEIEGLERVAESEVLGRLRVRVGTRYNREALSLEAGRLFAQGQFHRIWGPYVESYQDGVRIRFRVEEKPRVQIVRFRGRSALSESDLLGGTPPMRTREGDLYNEYLVTQDEETIREKYLAEGYLFVEVRHSARETTRGLEVTFDITEGTKVRVSEIRFVGNRAFSSGELLSLMRTREWDVFLFGLWRSGYYKHDDLQVDIVQLKRHYRSHGYLDVEIEPDDLELEKTNDERLVLQIRIDEGEQYVFRGYRFRGNKVFADRTLRDLTTSPIGKPFNAERMEVDRQAILDYYKDRAYIFADAREEYVDSFDRNDLYIVFDVEENNEIYIDKIKVRGNIKTQDRVIRRELEFYPGERVDKSKLDKSRSNLARLGIFQDISYAYEDSDLPSSKDLVVNVHEADSGQLIVGFGVTSGFGLIGNFQYSKRNFDMLDWPESFYDLTSAFTGAGQTLNLTAQPGTHHSRYRATFIEPYLFDTRNALSLTAQKLDLLREDWEEGRLRFEPMISHAFDFDRDLSIFFGIRFVEVEITDLEPDAPPDAFEVEGHTTVVSTEVGMRYDKRLIEPFEGPFDGHRERISYSLAGEFLGGDVDYHSVHLSQDLYFPLYTHREGNYHHVIAFKNRFGWRKSIDTGEEIPLFERFYLGGPQDVRGFRYRGLGPHQNGEPVGGTQELWGNLEYSFPIFQKLLRGVVWLDWGDLAPVTDFRLAEMRYAAGGGVRINFPFFGGRPLPIGLYFGTPISKERGDEARVFLFTIGDSF